MKSLLYSPVITLNSERICVSGTGATICTTHPPPPIPATARAAISASIEGAIPQKIVPDPRREIVKIWVQ